MKVCVQRWKCPGSAGVPMLPPVQHQALEGVGDSALCPFPEGGLCQREWGQGVLLMAFWTSDSGANKSTKPAWPGWKGRHTHRKSPARRDRMYRPTVVSSYLCLCLVLSFHLSFESCPALQVNGLFQRLEFFNKQFFCWFSSLLQPLLII